MGECCVNNLGRVSQVGYKRLFFIGHTPVLCREGKSTQQPEPIVEGKAIPAP